MTEWAASLLTRYFGLTEETALKLLHVTGIIGAALLFVMLATSIVASEAFFLGGRNPASMTLGSVPNQNILAPRNVTYVSEVLTEFSRQEAVRNVPLVYDPPDPNVSRTQSQFARQILDFVRNVRRDIFGTTEQKINDISQITALTLTDEQINYILSLSPEAWQTVDDEIINVLERVMRESIRESDLNVVRTQLPTQVSIRFSAQESEIIVAIVEDLIRPNTFPNEAATEAARQQAAANVAPVERTFALNEVVVRQNEPIDSADLEALEELDLLKSEDRQLRELAQASLASVLVIVITGLYIARFEPYLFENSRFVMLLAAIFLIVLAGARLVIATGQLYLYPAAALALLYVSISSARIALIGVLNLAFLIGLMAGGSLEATTLVTAGGVIGILTLRSTDRLNNYFMAGLTIGLANTVVAAVFNMGVTNTVSVTGTSLPLLVPFSLVSGIFAAAAAIAGMYLVTLLFNLPTSLKLAELSQPNQPLLQRLLREAPGTYQHSLQVANLSEQAALAVSANAELVRVSALYHDIGKMLNPVFFSENQQMGGGNPHDVLDDPYRSADIIISHVTEGDSLAREYRLPNRMRDFIREHHGTTEVYVFYRKAVNAAGGDESEVDIEEFRYPGPRPQTRETAIMMLADSCESAVRSIGPTSKQQVSEIIHDIVETRMRSGQLDESNLTLNDIKAIQRVFIEMLQAVYHPRIDYKKVTSSAPTIEHPAVQVRSTQSAPTVKADSPRDTPVRGTPRISPPVKPEVEQPVPVDETAEPELLEDEDDAPLLDVPALPRVSDARSGNNKQNGASTRDEAQPDKQEEPRE